MGAAKLRSLVTGAVYVLMLVGVVLAFFWVRQVGAGLTAPPPLAGPAFGAGGAAHGGGTGAAPADALPHVLLALVVILVVSRLMGSAFRWLRQPPVVGEVLAGILLGPSLLGRVAPGALAYLLPPTVAPYLGVIAQVGVILFMFLVGLEFDPAVLRQRMQSTIAISHASITLPFLLGTLLALALYPRVSTRDVPFTAFALFLGVSMSITAFPVLARILTDRGIQRTRLGVVALTCAAVDDATAWCLLAFVVSVVNAGGGAGAVRTVLLTAAYVGLLLLLRRPMELLVRRRDEGGLTPEVLTMVFVALLASALITDTIGVHAIFGAFLLGVIVPHDSRIAHDLREHLSGIVMVLLLPAFFAFTGLRTQVGLLSRSSDWLLLLGIVLIASLGKVGGSLAAARLTGLGWRDAASRGVLMNTRGLVELIVLNIGLDLHVLSPLLFAMLVLMALLTTMATAPLLDLLQAAPAPLGVPDAVGVTEGL
jgi:Kef-type K+ transport system membrane component KefB